jgi:capsular polysaccharide biosynthesis protein
MSENHEPNYYDDVINLRELVKTLLKYKWIIIGATVLAALAALLTSKFILPPKYEAAAYVGITLPSFEVDLEPSINNPSPLDDYRLLTETTKALPDLAEAVEVWLSVCEEMDLTCLGEDNDKPDLEAALVGTSQLKLTVTSDDPEQAAEFANLWAKEVIKRWDLIYGIGDIDLIQLDEEVAQALEKWNTA